MQYQSEDIINQRYQVIAILGQGGTAITYEVKDLELNVNVAMKVLSLNRITDWKIVDLFEREAKALANLNHPRIPKYIDYFYLDLESTRNFFLIQELIPGRSLVTLVEQGWYFQENNVREIAQQILSILVYLHSLKPTVIHRDIKPHNIIQAETGDIYLVDFGAVQDVYRNTLTRGGTFVGTIDYMPPEQLRGKANFSSDIYSLGCTLLYLLTKRSPLELPLKNMKLDFRDRVNISYSFVDWIDTAIEPAMEDRFRSTEEALDWLCNHSSFERLLPHKPKPSNSYLVMTKTKEKLSIQTPKFKKRNNWVDLIFLLIPIIVIVLVVLNWQLLMDSEDPLGTVLIPLVFAICFSSFIWEYVVVRDYAFAIEINRINFSIFLKFIFFQYQLKGNTQDISNFQVISKPNSHGSYDTKYCAFWYGVKQIKFARGTTTSEKYWIATEIINFLVKVNPRYDNMNSG